MRDSGLIDNSMSRATCRPARLATSQRTPVRLLEMRMMRHDPVSENGHAVDIPPAITTCLLRFCFTHTALTAFGFALAIRLDSMSRHFALLPLHPLQEFFPPFLSLLLLGLHSFLPNFQKPFVLSRIPISRCCRCYTLDDKRSIVHMRDG